MYATNEILFPAYVIPQLKESRGPKWQALIDHLSSLPEQHEEVLALMLMMIRLNGCMECETDSYRAMKGCHACAVQTLRRLKADDDYLLNLYQNSLGEVKKYLTRTGKSGLPFLIGNNPLA
jgi:hypothetical protein